MFVTYLDLREHVFIVNTAAPGIVDTWNGEFMGVDIGENHYVSVNDPRIKMWEQDDESAVDIVSYAFSKLRLGKTQDRDPRVGDYVVFGQPRGVIIGKVSAPGYVNTYPDGWRKPLDSVDIIGVIRQRWSERINDFWRERMS